MSGWIYLEINKLDMAPLWQLKGSIHPAAPSVLSSSHASTQRYTRGNTLWDFNDTTDSLYHRNGRERVGVRIGGDNYCEHEKLENLHEGVSTSAEHTDTRSWNAFKTTSYSQSHFQSLLQLFLTCSPWKGNTVFSQLACKISNYVAVKFLGGMTGRLLESQMTRENAYGIMHSMCAISKSRRAKWNMVKASY